MSDAPAQSHRFVYVAAIFAALGGLLFGYDTGVISGALLFIRRAFALSTFAQEVVVSAVLVGATGGALAGGRVADTLGRRRVLIATAAIFSAGAILCAAAPSPTVLIAGRLIVGVAIGLASTTVPVYLSEVAPPASRGWLVSLFQLAVTVGILVAYVTDLVFAPSGGWRWMLGLAAVPAFVFGTGMLLLPETPRWLLRAGRQEQARGVLIRIRATTEVAQEILEITESLDQQREKGRVSALLDPMIRPAVIVGIGLAVLQQITGINTVIYYAPRIFQTAGISSASGAILATAGVGLVNFLATIVAMRLVDRRGRRPLLLTGIAGMAVSLVVLAAAFRFSASGGWLAWVSVITVMTYVGSFAISLGPIFWLLIAEIYPLRIRGVAEGTAAAFNWGSNFLVSLTFLTLLERIGASSTFLIYALASAGAWLFAYFLVPETKGRSLEEIERFWRAGEEGRRARAA